MAVNWEARRRRIAEFKYLNTADITPALIAEKARDLAHRYRDAAIPQAELRGRDSSTTKVQEFWKAVAQYLTEQQ